MSGSETRRRAAHRVIRWKPQELPMDILANIVFAVSMVFMVVSIVVQFE